MSLAWKCLQMWGGGGAGSELQVSGESTLQPRGDPGWGAPWWKIGPQYPLLIVKGDGRGYLALTKWFYGFDSLLFFSPWGFVVGASDGVPW